MQSLLLREKGTAKKVRCRRFLWLFGAALGAAVLLLLSGVAVTSRGRPGRPRGGVLTPPSTRRRRTPPRDSYSPAPTPAQSERSEPKAVEGPPEDWPLPVALSVHSDKMATKLDKNIEQSSAVFVDFSEPKSDGWRLPTPLAGTEEIEVDGTDCRSSDFVFSAERDATCLRYLGAVNKTWKRLKPMYAILMDARTIKFKAKLESGVWTILKLAQFKFMFEPYSEFLAFHVDRLLGLYRVPPVAWALIPADWLRAAASATMNSFYVQWLERYILSRKELQHAIKPWLNHWTGQQQALWLTAQLWMEGVKPLARTGAGLPPGFNAMLDPSSGRWPPPDGAQGLWRLGELSDLYVFDHIIGNSDRTPNKNAFGVGQCNNPAWDCSKTEREDGKKLRPRMVFVDQGSSFYGLGEPQRSPLRSNKKGNSTICRFRRRTIDSVMSLRGDSLKRGIIARVPRGSGFWMHAKKWQPDGAQKRLEAVALQVERCIENHGKEAVFAFG
eukprot:Hpha_TRINITY_DN34333_c0_g1::TRINITY_DN34333_c0_g1_i1::g.109671::m.109671